MMTEGIVEHVAKNRGGTDDPTRSDKVTSIW